MTGAWGRCPSCGVPSFHAFECGDCVREALGVRLPPDYGVTAKSVDPDAATIATSHSSSIAGYRQVPFHGFQVQANPVSPSPTKWVHSRRSAGLVSENRRGSY